MDTREQHIMVLAEENFLLKTIKAIPTREIKNQNTGAVYSTIDSKFWRENAAPIINKIVIAAWLIIAFLGAPQGCQSRHPPKHLPILT
jgi:hypothetical protein